MLIETKLVVVNDLDEFIPFTFLFELVVISMFFDGINLSYFLFSISYAMCILTEKIRFFLLF